MAKFDLQPGEKKVVQEEVSLVDNQRTYPATLILTSRRAVLTWAKTPPTWLWAFNWMIALVAKAAAHAGEQVRFQMGRDRFASVEQGDGGILVFRDTGEGYEHTSFAIKSHTSFAVWKERMQRWASGAEDRAEERDSDEEDDGDAAELPEARVVERSR